MKISNVEINTYKIPLPEPVEAYAAGVMESSWRHYFHRYTNEQDRLTTGLIQEVKIIEEPKAKKTRGGKK